jgi:hypothetical protein
MPKYSLPFLRYLYFHTFVEHLPDRFLTRSLPILAADLGADANKLLIKFDIEPYFQE